MYSDLQTIAPEQYMKTITKRLTDLHAVSVSTFPLFSPTAPTPPIPPTHPQEARHDACVGICGSLPRGWSRQGLGLAATILQEEWLPDAWCREAGTVARCVPTAPPAA